jgi:hypothetical protein
MGAIAQSYGSKVETTVGRFFQFLKIRESWFFEYFSKSKNCQFRFFGKTIQNKKTLKEPTNFHERTGQEPMIFWPVFDFFSNFEDTDYIPKSIMF